MPPTRDSWLAARPVVTAVAPDGSVRPVVALRLAQRRPAGPRVHRVVQGDELDLVAHRQLGDAGLWWRVLDVNPVRYPLDLVPGELLALPEAGPATRTSRARSF